MRLSEKHGLREICQSLDSRIKVKVTVLPTKTTVLPALVQPVDFETFIAEYPDTGRRYELHDGVVIEMPKPSGNHSNLTGFLIEELILTIVQMGKRGEWTIPREAIVKANAGKSGYEPDIIVLDQQVLPTESRWAKESVIESAAAVKLIVEVVSQNWRDDYFKKRADYEEMGIPEYWIVDYAAIGGRNFLGQPKQPTLFVYQLIDGEYQVASFRGDRPIASPTFPDLNLTAKQVLQAGSHSVQL